jgi:polyprenyl-phospho-N-acetylgalactosaminyl synthase
LGNARSIFVIVPAFNEATVIRETVQQLLQKGYSVIVVDDGSTDNTEEVLRSMPIQYIRHGANLGQGAALQTGLEYAINTGATYVVTFDADGQHDVADIDTMLTLLEKNKAGIVFGSRFLEGSKTNMRMSRRLVLRIARFVNYLASGILLTDANNGLRVMTSETARLISITENRSSHSAQIQNLVKRNRIRYVECPVHISYSAYSKQKGVRNISSIRILYDLILYKIFR